MGVASATFCKSQRLYETNSSVARDKSCIGSTPNNLPFRDCDASAISGLRFPGSERNEGKAPTTRAGNAVPEGANQRGAAVAASTRCGHKHPVSCSGEVGKWKGREEKQYRPVWLRHAGFGIRFQDQQPGLVRRNSPNQVAIVQGRVCAGRQGLLRGPADSIRRENIYADPTRRSEDPVRI